eukprot:m.31226 g.31226  ORF g.31226 m.31226 type:complete len:311 (+) comp12298_c0_seq1:489-1421(+)
MSRGKTAAWRALESVDMSKTVSSVVSATTAALRRAGIPEPQLSVEHLMAETLAGSDGSRNRVGTLALAHDRALTDTETAAFDSMITKRLDRMPIQMILGSWDFHNITLKVQPGILCPRPETELLVDLALTGLSSHASPRVVDVGAGTGAIGLAILNEHQHATCDAIDIDPAAVTLSLSNASSLGVADRYSCRADGIGPFARWHSASRSPPYDMLVSNPPYIPDAVRGTLSPEVERYEAGTALFAGHDGLVVLREIIDSLDTLVTPSAPVLLEVDCSHADRVVELLSHRRPRQAVRIECDLDGRPRFAVAM